MAPKNHSVPTEPVEDGQAVAKPRHVRWSEWVCATPWRTLLAWIALSVVALYIFSSRFGNDFYVWLWHALDDMPFWLPLPMRVHELVRMCWLSGILLAFTWFQPLLLRLDSTRSCAWIAVFVVTPLIAAIALPQGLDDFLAFFPLIVGTTAALASRLLMIGQRTRPWFGLLSGFALMVGLIAASWYVFGLFGRSEPWAELLREMEYIIAVFGFPSWMPVGSEPMAGFPSLSPGLVVLTVGNVAFAIPLIFGTKRIERGGAESASMPRRLEAKA